jgi:hypothetical protein
LLRRREGHPARRPPLGLAPALGPDDADDDKGDRDDAYLGPAATAAKIVAKSIANLSEEQLAAAVTWRDMFEYAIGGTIETSFSDGDFLREKLRELRKEIADGQAAQRAEIAELKAALVEARHEVRELKLVQESMRIANRGERGVDGARGVPGRDGQQGPAGPRGERGEPGAKAAGFILNVPEYSAALVLSDGSPAAVLRLRPMFEAFAEATIAEDEE